MLFVVREIAGWGLVAIALFLIRMGINFVSDPADPKIVEAGVIMFAATAVLRSGIMLVRVSTAARICSKEKT